jgi:bacillithiol system protein YtxJ
MALRLLESGWKDDIAIPCFFLDLLNYRDISNSIAQTYSVKHESPQVLLIKNARCVYSASHAEVNPETILAHLPV